MGIDKELMYNPPIPPFKKGGVGGILFIAMTALFCISCQFRVPKEPTTLMQPIGADPDSLNPVTSNDGTQHMINRFIYDSLIKLDKDTSEPLPNLAEKWDISEDHLTYIFHLRHNVYWHDGEPFTAEDVLYTFNIIRDPKVDATAARVDIKTVDKIEELDPYTVKFIFNKPDYKGILFVGLKFIIPKHVFNDGENFNAHPANRNPIGTGPYRFMKWTTGSKIELKRNESYWGIKPDIKGITFKIISDSGAEFQVLKKGELDLGALRPIQWVRQANTKNFNSRFNKLEYYLPTCTFIGWNLDRPYFNDKRVRVALTKMINREGIKEKLYFGKAKVLSSCFDISSSEYDESIVPYPYDPKSSKELLTEAGWVDRDGDGVLDKDGVSFKFNLVIPGGDAASLRMITMMREDFMQVGIVMDIQQLEWATFLKQIEERKFDALSLAWVNTPDSDPYQIWHSSQIKDGSNFVGFANKEVDELLEKARSEFDERKRNQMYYRVQEVLHEEQPYTFLFAGESLVAVDKRFSNVKAHLRGIDLLEWKLK